MSPNELRYLSPLRYPGGKSSLGRFFRALVVENDLIGGHYIEPYAGGASIALSLLAEELVETVTINDRDPAIFSFWHSVVFETEEMCERIIATPISIAEWKHQRQVYLSNQSSTIDRGFAAFYLNRTNRSGVIASGRPIGGLAQNGRFTLGARYNAPELAGRVRRIGSYRERVRVLCKDALDLIVARTKLIGRSRRALWYLDPPYYGSNFQRLYSSHYQDRDHARVATALATMNLPWVVTYDDEPRIRQLYSRYRQWTYFLDYVAARRRRGMEVMCFSPQLQAEWSHSIAWSE